MAKTWGIPLQALMVLAPGLLLAPSGAFARDARQTAANTYDESFGSADPQMHEGELDSATSGDSEALNALRAMGSFPARVTVGDRSLGWTDGDRQRAEPKPVERHFKAGACEFALKTADFSLRRYERSGTDLVVSADSVARYSTMTSPNNEPILMSVNADIIAKVDAGHRQACKTFFSSHRIKFGTIDLANTALTADSDSGASLPTVTTAAPKPVTVYLRWDKAKDQLTIEDASGLAPAAESSVFEVNPKTTGDYYLSVKAQLGLERGK